MCSKLSNFIYHSSWYIFELGNLALFLWYYLVYNCSQYVIYLSRSVLDIKFKHISRMIPQNCILHLELYHNGSCKWMCFWILNVGNHNLIARNYLRAAYNVDHNFFLEFNFFQSFLSQNIYYHQYSESQFSTMSLTIIITINHSIQIRTTFEFKINTA